MDIPYGISYPVDILELDGTDMKLSIYFNVNLKEANINKYKTIISFWHEIASENGFCVGEVHEIFELNYDEIQQSIIMRFSIGNATLQTLYILLYILDQSINFREFYFPFKDDSKIKIIKAVLSDII